LAVEPDPAFPGHLTGARDRRRVAAGSSDVPELVRPHPAAKASRGTRGCQSSTQRPREPSPQTKK